MRKYLPGIILFSGILGMLLYLCPGVLLSPNTRLLGIQDDALKNYYTPEYHVRHDSSYTWFGGMNYPFGDQIVFSDAQPGLSNGIKFISSLGLDLSGHVTGILNVCIFLSLFLGGFFLYRILRFLGTESTWAAISAVLILCLSPQLYRLTGHYALAYTAFIPGLWYLALLSLEKKQIRYAFLIFLWVTLWSFIHPYLLMLALLFLSAWWGFVFLFRFGGSSRKSAIWNFIIQGILPFAVFSLWMFFTDPVGDRPSNPYGYFEYRAWWTTVFFPLYLPHGELLSPYMDTYRFSWEGYAYVGFASIIFIFISLFILSKKFIQGFRNKSTGEGIPPFVTLSVLSAFFILLFSMRYPFIGPLRDWVYSIPGLSQFRSIGRFAWIFYYVWTVISAWGFWKLVQHLSAQGKKFLSLSLSLFLLCVTAAEGGMWMHHIRPGSFEKPGTGESPLPVWKKFADPDKYCAMMVLPFFHIGSENYTLINSGSVKDALMVSLETGIPLVNSMMSRTSFVQGMQQLQLVMEEFNPLSVVTLYEKKPLLIVSLKKVRHDRAYFLPAKGKLIYEDEEANVYELSWHMLMKAGNARFDKEVDSFILKQDSLILTQDGFLLDQEDPIFYHQSYDDSMPGMQYAGKGGMEKTGWDFNYLYRGKVPVTKSEKVRASVWICGIENQRPLSELWVETLNADSVAQHFWIGPAGTDGVVIDKGWILMDHEFTVNPGEEIRIMVRKDSKFPRKVKFDEFQLRLSDTDVYQIKDNWLMHNNRFWDLRNRKIPERNSGRAEEKP